ncbi:hypothetical protein HDC90_003791 [Pedobacter sp. AK013]|nr:hypothetical protein [Pedobacter sp. AK013]
MSYYKMLLILIGSIFFINKKYTFAIHLERCQSKGPLWGVLIKHAWKVGTNN